MLEAKIRRQVKPDKRIDALTTIPGIGLLITRTLVSEIGDITRFATAGKMCVCVGRIIPWSCVPIGTEWVVARPTPSELAPSKGCPDHLRRQGRLSSADGDPGLCLAHSSMWPEGHRELEIQLVAPREELERIVGASRPRRPRIPGQGPRHGEPVSVKRTGVGLTIVGGDIGGPPFRRTFYCALGSPAINIARSGPCLSGRRSTHSAVCFRPRA